MIPVAGLKFIAGAAVAAVLTCAGGGGCAPACVCGVTWLVDRAGVLGAMFCPGGARVPCIGLARVEGDKSRELAPATLLVAPKPSERPRPADLRTWTIKAAAVSPAAARFSNKEAFFFCFFSSLCPTWSGRAFMFDVWWAHSLAVPGGSSPLFSFEKKSLIWLRLRYGTVHLYG